MHPCKSHLKKKQEPISKWICLLCLVGEKQFSCMSHYANHGWPKKWTNIGQRNEVIKNRMPSQSKFERIKNYLKGLVWSWQITRKDTTFCYTNSSKQNNCLMFTLYNKMNFGPRWMKAFALVSIFWGVSRTKSAPTAKDLRDLYWELCS